jgi:hypothetical protein
MEAMVAWQFSYLGILEGFMADSTVSFVFIERVRLNDLEKRGII